MGPWSRGRVGDISLKNPTWMIKRRVTLQVEKMEGVGTQEDKGYMASLLPADLYLIVQIDHDVRNAFVVLKNMNLLQKNMHSLSLGPTSRWSTQPSDQENMILAATSSMCTVVSALTESVVTAVSSLIEAPSMHMGELDASLKRYRTHMSTIQGNHIHHGYILLVSKKEKWRS